MLPFFDSLKQYWRRPVPETGSGLALLPLLFFILLFLGAGLVLTFQGQEKAFYQISPAVVILPAILLSVLIGRSKVTESLSQFLQGAGHLNIITMCFIYLLAGAYSDVMQAIGGVESTVNFSLRFISGFMLLPGIFITTSFISLAMGTSMGTIAAMTPIVLSIADASGISFPLAMGALVGGAMFGDNLSMISDTTIAAVQTQKTTLKDKFQLNFSISFPAMVITVLVLAVIGTPGDVTDIGPYQLIKVLPYGVVLGLALLGMNVLVVLTLGLLCAGVIGIATVDGFTLFLYGQKIYTGFTKMMEILILTLMIGGLGEMVKQQGGLSFLIDKISRFSKIFAHKVNSRIVGEFGIGALVSMVDVCTANNTVAILISGDAAEEIAKKDGVEPRRAASLLDIFSCVIQGILPYSAQILLVGSLSEQSPFSIITNNHYCFILGGLTILAILVGYPRDIFGFKEKS